MAKASIRGEQVIFIAGCLLVLLATVAIFWQDEGNLITLMALAAGMILVIGSLYRYVEVRGREDERVRKIVAFAALNAWLTTMFLLMGLIALSFLGRLEPMSQLRMLALITFLALAVYLGWYAYFTRRGDVT